MGFSRGDKKRGYRVWGMGKMSSEQGAMNSERGLPLLPVTCTGGDNFGDKVLNFFWFYGIISMRIKWRSLAGFYIFLCWG